MTHKYEMIKYKKFAINEVIYLTSRERPHAHKAVPYVNFKHLISRLLTLYRRKLHRHKNRLLFNS